MHTCICICVYVCTYWDDIFHTVSVCMYTYMHGLISYACKYMHVLGWHSHATCACAYGNASFIFVWYIHADMCGNVCSYVNTFLLILLSVQYWITFVYICMCTYVYAQDDAWPCRFAHTYAYNSTTSTCMYVHMFMWYLCIYTYICVCVCVHVLVRVFIRMYRAYVFCRHISLELYMHITLIVWITIILFRMMETPISWIKYIHAWCCFHHSYAFTHSSHTNLCRCYQYWKQYIHVSMRVYNRAYVDTHQCVCIFASVPMDVYTYHCM